MKKLVSFALLAGLIASVGCSGTPSNTAKPPAATPKAGETAPPK